MTLQTMGVELVSVRTALTLEQALAMLGLDVQRAEEADERDADRDLWAEDGSEGERLRQQDEALTGRSPDGRGSPPPARRRLRFAD